MSKYLESFLTHQNMTLFKSHYSKTQITFECSSPKPGDLENGLIIYISRDFDEALLLQGLYRLHSKVPQTPLWTDLVLLYTKQCAFHEIPHLFYSCSYLKSKNTLAVCTSKLDIISQLSLHQNISQTFSPMSDRTRLRRPLPPSRRRLLQHFSMGADSSFLACSKYIHPSI